MTKNIRYKVYAQIINDLPTINIIIHYKDDFSDDRYVFKSESTSEKGTENIPFIITKNGKNIGELTLNKENISSFYNDFFEKVQDIDFQTEFSNIEHDLSQEVLDFLKYYDDAIVMNGVTLEGELRRMQNIARIK